MTRLEELFLKWRDREIGEVELRELNDLLRNSEARRQLFDAFRFDVEVADALRAVEALARSAASVRDFQTLELREAEPFAEQTSNRGFVIYRWLHSLRNLCRPGMERWQFWGGLATLAAVVTLVALRLPTRNIAALEGNVVGVTVLRGERALPAGVGFGLRTGDRVKTSGDNNAFVRYLKEPTVIKLLAGTQLKLEQDASGKRLEVLVGTISAKVAAQPPGHPMMIATPHADAKVIGTEFMLNVESASTHLEVIEGSVQLCNREDGKAIVVGRDHFATVTKGVELVSRSLLPAPWNSQDIGAVGMTGYARIEGQRCKIKAAGKPDTKTKDQYHFLYQTLEADGEIRARVVDVELTHHLAKAGVVIRDNLKPNAPQAFLYLKAGSGLEFEHRSQSQNIIDRVGIEAAPYWLRLARRGEWVQAYKSADGQNWTQVGSERIKMHGKIYVGLGVNSWDNSKLATSVFDNVSVTAETNAVAEISQK
jgi:hypothetical protein